MTPSKDIARLIEIMAALRTPKTGCPWDLDQTFASIAPYTIEEAYEVADAIERENMPELKDELGDLLLQVVYHARMADEQNAFAFGDVVEAVTTKMIRRHPHVFGDATARATGAAKGFWDDIKAKEKAAKASSNDTSLLADVPVTLPGMTRAIKLQSKAAKVGFDWPDIAPVFAKLQEEIREFEEVAKLSDPRRPALASEPRNGHADAKASDVRIKEEFGDILFVMANIARHLEIDPETALRGANQKFTRRFAYIEQRLAERGKTPTQSDLAEMDALWDEIRAADRDQK